MIVSRGQTPGIPPTSLLEQNQRRSKRDLLPMSLTSLSTPLEKLGFGDPDADSSVTVRLQLFAHDGAFDRRDHAVNRRIQ